MLWLVGDDYLVFILLKEWLVVDISVVFVVCGLLVVCVGIMVNFGIVVDVIDDFFFFIYGCVLGIDFVVVVECVVVVIEV